MTAPVFLPYGRQTVTEADIAAVAEVLRSDFLTQGPVVGQFERAFADYVGAPYAIACANGTAALHAVYTAIGFAPGEAAIVPSITFLATASAAHFAGAAVFFVTSIPIRGLPDQPTSSRRSLAPKPKGSVPACWRRSIWRAKPPTWSLSPSWPPNGTPSLSKTLATR